MAVCYAMAGTTITCHVTLVFSIVMATPLSYQDVTLHLKYPATTQHHPTPNTAQHRNQTSWSFCYDKLVRTCTCRELRERTLSSPPKLDSHPGGMMRVSFTSPLSSPQLTPHHNIINLYFTTTRHQDVLN